MAFVVNGELLPTESQFPRYQTFMPPMSTSWDGWKSASYAAMYRSHLWVYVVVSKRARATARLPFPVYRKDGLDRKRDPKHPMAALLENPNPSMSGWDLWLWTASTQDLCGIAWWYKFRHSDGQVKALLPIHPSKISKQEDGRYRITAGAQVVEGVPDFDLVRFSTFDPSSFDGGVSPLEPLRATLENEFLARAATTSFWSRGARPSLALKHKKNLSDAAQRRLRDQVEANHVGAKNAGSVLILEEDMQVETFELTAEESQYIETRKLNREEVCAAYDTPPPVVHILDRATFSNITEQMRSMYRDTMAPILRGFESAVERQLRAAEWPDDDVYAEFLMDEVLRGDFEQRAEAYAKATHMTIAEKRKAENLPFIDGTDRIFLNTATMPLDLIDARVQMPAGSGDGLTTLSVNSLRTVMGRLTGATKTADVDEWALTEGLGAIEADAVIELHAAHYDDPDLSGFKAALKAIREES